MQGNRGNMAVTYIALALLAIIALGAIGGFGALAAFFSGNPLQQAENEVGFDPLTCDSTTTPSVDIRTYDRDNVGTTLTEATNSYRVVGQKTWTTFTADTSFEANPGAKLEVLLGATSADQTDNAYGEFFTYTVPCTENPVVEKAVAQDEVETELSATFYNADDNAAAEAFSAGQTQTVSIRLQAGVDQYFGNPYAGSEPNVLCLNLNSTAWDKPESVRVDGGSALSSVSTPQRHTLETGKIAYCYELPVVDDARLDILLELNADDSTAPAADDTAYVYAGSNYINAETGAVEVGVEDEDGNAVGTDAADSVTLDFTA